MGIFLRTTVAILVFTLSAFSLAVAAEAPPQQYSNFDSGQTVVIEPGQSFTVLLECKHTTPAKWVWPSIPDQVLKLVSSAPMPELNEAVQRTVYTFRAVAPGTVDLFAELVDNADPTKVHARFALTVQVKAEE